MKPKWEVSEKENNKRNLAAKTTKPSKNIAKNYAKRLVDFKQRTEAWDLNETAAEATASNAIWAMVFKFCAALKLRTQRRS